MINVGKGKVIPIQGWKGPEGSKGWDFQNF